MMSETQPPERLTKRAAKRRATEQISTLDSTLRERLASIRDALAQLRAADIEAEFSGPQPSGK
jgi:signal transduction histidine kinase